MRTNHVPEIKNFHWTPWSKKDAGEADEIRVWKSRRLKTVLTSGLPGFSESFQMEKNL